MVVDRQQDKAHPHSEQAIDGLASRLDAHAAERILRRAIELHSDDQDDTYDLSLIHKVAAELHIPPEYVAAAMAEELQVSPAAPLRLIERLFIRDRIAVTRIAHDSVDEVTERTKTWMSRHEGLRVAKPTPQGIQWAKNPSPMVAVKASLKMQQGTGVLRSARHVTTEFRPIGDATAVSVSADARLARAGAISAAALSSVGLAVLNGVLWDSLFSFQYAIAVVLGIVISVAIAAAVAKAWATSVRTGLDRAATGITDPETLESHESVPAMLSRFASEWRGADRDKH